MPNTIVLKGDPLRKEELAGGAISPGDLIELNSSGVVVRHATAGANAVPMFAVEMDLIGSGITNSYPSGDTVKFVVSRPGDEIYALLASGQNVAKGAFLESAGNGALRAYTQQSGSNVFPAAIVAKAVEAVNNTAGDATGPHNTAKRIKVEVV